MFIIPPKPNRRDDLHNRVQYSISRAPFRLTSVWTRDASEEDIKAVIAELEESGCKVERKFSDPQPGDLSEYGPYLYITF